MKNEIMSAQFDNTKKWIILSGLAITLAGLSLMAYLGFFNRYWGDDWCYNADFNSLGIGGTLNTYFMTGQEALRGYSNNRYSLTLLTGLLYLMGISGAKITATLVIGLWLTGLSLLLNNFSKIHGVPNRNMIIFIAAVLLYYALYISPQRFQVLYWIAGIHYSFSIISGIFILAMITYQITLDQRNKVIDVLIAPLAFFAGGLSETSAAYLLSITFLILAAALWRKRKQAVWAIRAYPTTLIAFIFLLASLIVLSLSPSNSARVDYLSSQPHGLLTTLLLSARFSFDFMLDSIKSLIVPHLVFMIIFLSLSLLSAGSAGVDGSPIWRKALLMGLVLMTVWLLVSAIYAPTAYFYGTPPDPRVKSLARFTMLAGLAVISWLIGDSIQNRFHGSFFVFVAILGIAASMIYTARSITSVYAQLDGFKYRAQLWDQRDADIKAAKSQGETRVAVKVIDMKGVNVRDMMSSTSIDKEWVTTCSSRYYALEAIKAIEP